MNCGAMLIARDDDAGHVTLLDLVVDAGERDRELVVREADVREVGVDAGEVLGVEVDVEVPLGGLVVHAPTIQPDVCGERRHDASPRSSRQPPGRRSSSSGLRTPSHGDYATNVALRLAPESSAAARARGGARATRSQTSPQVEQAEVAGPGFVNLWVGARRGTATRWRSCSTPARVRRRLRRRRASVIQVELVSANPTGPIDSRRRRGTAHTATRSRACSSSRATRSSASTTTTTRAPRWTASAASVEAVRRGERPAGGRLPGRVHRRARRARGRSGPDDARADRGVARALPRPLRLVGAAERARAAARASCCRGSTRTRRTARSGRARPRTATTTTASSSARTAARPTYRAADVVYLVDKLERGFDHALYVLGADHHGTRNWYARDRAHARLRPRAGRGAAVPARPPDARRRADEDVEAARRRRLPRRLRRRGRRRRRALVSRLARPRPDDRDRRRPRARALGEEPGLLRAVRARPDRRHPAERRATRASSAEPPAELAREERDLVKRLAEFPRVVAEATERRAPARDPDVRDPRRRRLPPLLPPSPRARSSEAQAFRLGLCVATKTVIARCLDLIGVEAPDRM